MNHGRVLAEQQVLAGEVFSWLDGLLSNVKDMALNALVVVGLVFAVVQFVRMSGVLKRAAMVLVATACLFVLATNVSAIGDAIRTEVPFLSTK